MTESPSAENSSAPGSLARWRSRSAYTALRIELEGNTGSAGSGCKKEWFLRLNPNGRIPVVVDNTRSPPFPVFETSAQLLYLADHFDKDHKFGFTDPLARRSSGYFSGTAGARLGIARFKNESLRVFGVLEIRLSGTHAADKQPRHYLVGAGKGKYSIADIKTWA
ncbi:hypothetical protein C8R44DRAFT_886339 [Mycena epipterygia]|nr:hypothetical protein C8R44DRAFT_886339 [Mycena epipterygia]